LNGSAPGKGPPTNRDEGTLTPEKGRFT
jgi:hypothetical protein